MKYVTYHLKRLEGIIPIAVKIEKNQEYVGYDVFFDACSLCGLSNVRINNTGRLRKDIMIISISEHYKYDWKKLSDEYYNKCFNPNNF